MLRMTPEQVAAHNARIGAAPVKEKAKPEKTAKPSSDYETWLSNQLVAAGMPKPAHQFRWLDDRLYRADLAYPPLLIEIDGAAHRIKGRFMDDILKNQEALLNGYYLLRIATSQVRNGLAVGIVRKALERVKAYAPVFAVKRCECHGVPVENCPEAA